MKNNFLTFILCFPIFISAQVRDTIVVYDTIFVKDTIWIENINIEKLKNQNLVLQLDTIKKAAQVLVFNNEISATLPIKSIVYNEQFNQLSNLKHQNMKKLNFFGLMLIAFQTMVLAQSDYGVTFGSKLWMPSKNNPDINSPELVGFQLGGFFKYPVLHKNFSVGVDLNYGFFKGKNNYNLINNASIDDALFDYYNKNFKNAFETNYHNISVPIYFTWEKSNFKPFVGLEYSKKRSSGTFSIDAEPNEKYAIVINEYNLLTGIQYQIKNNYSIKLSYSRNIVANDFNYHRTEHTYGFSDLGLNNNTVGLTVSYHFNKKPVETNETIE